MSFGDAFQGTSGGRNMRQLSGGDLVSKNILTIQQNIAQIKKFSQYIGTSKDSLDIRRQINELIETTKELAQDTSTEIKDLRFGASWEEQNRGRILQQALSRDFQNALHMFQDVTKFSAQQEKAYGIPKPPPPQQQPSRSYDQSLDLDDFGTSGNRYGNNQSREQQQRSEFRELQIREQETNNLLIEERNQGIRDIERTVQDINEIFVDLSNLVSEQGSMIDNIESNIESTNATTARATEELRTASKYQSKSRTKMCILLLILVILLAVIGGIIWVTVGFTKK